MCGIAGFINHQLNANQQKQLIDSMLQTITYRGPEASCSYIENQVVLGHNRLKIIDLSDEANQPFHYADVVIAFNGEVYNYIELREELKKHGYSFQTTGDTEVMCAAYKHWGEDCVKHFVGMWAFALWDKTLRKLFCSRDRFGIKPFYYITDGKDFYFGSEYKPLKLAPCFNGEVYIEQINKGLQMGWSEFGIDTYYEQILQLEPATNLVWQNGKITETVYWEIDIHAPISTLSFEEKKHQFFDLFVRSIELHSRSDVKNGTCLSGGIDSSAIASVYSTLMPNTPIQSFTVFYEGEGGVDERPFVHEVARKYGNIQPHFFSPTTEQVGEAFHRMAYHADVPVFGSSFLSQYFLMQLAKSQGVTVVIDGQGSDEYLAGYLHSFYRIIGGLFSRGKIRKGLLLLNALSEREHFSPKKKRDFLLKSLVSTFTNEQQISNLEYSKLNPLLIHAKTKGSIYFNHKHPDKLNELLLVLLMETTLPTLLHFEDRNSMAFSLESRVPFLDHRLVEFAFILQREEKINDRAETKFILRETLKNVLPKAVYERKDKKGFVTPGEVRWLNGPLKHLLEIDYKKFDWMKTEKLKQLVDNYKKGDTSNANMVWKIAATHYWLKHFA